MKIQTIITDRKALVDFLKEETGMSNQYLGAPGFQYAVGPYVVLRNADIETDQESAAKILGKLREKGVIETAEEEKGIQVPIPADSVKARMNLLNMISSKGKLISKAIGREGAVGIAQDFLQEIKKENPANVIEFREAMAKNCGATGLRGLCIRDDKVTFTSMPDDDSDMSEACRKLVQAMVQASETQRWVKPIPEQTENEKYTFRVWMISIGMSGKKYRAARNLLLSNLNGNVAYRTEAQQQAAMAKRATNQKRRKAEIHADFTIL